MNKPPVKEELKTLHLSKKAQDEISETLKYIHGQVFVRSRFVFNNSNLSVFQDFVFNDISKYEEKGNIYMKKYWVERGNLVVKGGFDYSQVKDGPEDEAEKLKVFALLRLER